MSPFTPPHPGAIERASITADEASNPDRYFWDSQLHNQYGWSDGKLLCWAFPYEVSGTIPIYIHEAPGPDRYFVDMHVDNSYGWSTGNVACWAYPPANAPSTGRVVITDVTCAAASTGVSSSLPAIEAAVSTVMGAIGAAVGAAAGIAATVATTGAATPLTFILPAVAAVETAAVTAAVMKGAEAAATSIGHSLPDQFYLTVNGTKVFPPKDKYIDLKTGDSLKTYPASVPNQPSTTKLERGGSSIWDTSGTIYSGAPGDLVTIELWDWDAVTSDDQLGYQVLDAKTLHPYQLYTMISAEESSIYIMGVAVV